MSTHLHELIEARLTRRRLLKGSSAAVAGAYVGWPAAVAAKADNKDDFTEVTAGYDGEVYWPEDTHLCDLVISWGDPIFAGAPEWEKGQTTAEAQSLQFGDSCDFTAFMPLPKGSKNSGHGLLVVNHEFVRSSTMFVGHTDPTDPERVRAEMAGHGMAVVEVKLTEDGWAPVLDSPHNRRITAHTPFRIEGPVAGHPRVKTPADPLGVEALGTLGNCAGGTTPWGTALSGEENIQRFWSGAVSPDDVEFESRQAMGIGKHLYWHFAEVDKRFDLSHSPHEPNRFGWIVEVDPYDPSSTPRKLTSLGRFCHEGAEVVVDKTGHIVVYMGDDTADQFLYRFVSAQTYDPANPTHHSNLLVDGTLSVAVFDDQGLSWIPLIHEGKLAEKFDSLADILIDTRMAAKWVGATPMDRPERVAVSPKTGRIYVMLTKNPDRQVGNAPNERVANYWGQILEIDPGKSGHTADKMTWDTLLQGGDASVASQTPGSLLTTPDGTLSCPDNAIFDSAGRLWVTTDGNPGASERYKGVPAADGLYLVDTDGQARGRSRLFFRGCMGSEITGPSFTPDDSTLFLSVQHPGESVDGGFGTCWPAPKDSGVPPRSTVVALRRKKGGALI